MMTSLVRSYEMKDAMSYSLQVMYNMHKNAKTITQPNMYTKFFGIPIKTRHQRGSSAFNEPKLPRFLVI
jgi:hypothetical protein